MGEVRVPIPAKPGQVGRYDSHYKRNGSANLFMFFDRHRRWRHVKVTARKTKQDFAQCMKELVDVHYPDATVIRVVMDNLSSHSAAALYETFSPEEARRLLRRLEFHFTPKHASWLNMVEIELGVCWFSVNRTSGGVLKGKGLVLWLADVARGAVVGPLLRPPAWHPAA